MREGTVVEWIRLVLVVVLIAYNLLNGFTASDSQWADYNRRPNDPVMRGNLWNALLRLLASFLFLVPALVAVQYGEGQTPHGWVLVSQWCYTAIIVTMLAVGYNIRRLQRSIR